MNKKLGINWPHIKQRLTFEARRIKSQGIWTISLKLISKSSSITLWFVLLPITALLHIAGYRRVTVFTDRIGHLALEPDCLLKEQAMGHIPKRKWIILAPPNRVANEHLLSYWEPYFIIVRQPSLCYIINSMSKWLLMRHDISHYVLAVGRTQTAYRIYAEWGDRPSILKLSEEDEQWANEKLKEMGLPGNAWFVCVHVREGGFSPIDEELHSHRNGNIENTIPAMQEITSQGGWVIRIGDQTMTPLTPMPQVIDYAHHPIKSARMDVILCAKAKFILGNTSGISIVGTIFGIPCALANIVPVTAIGFGIYDINIPKIIWSNKLLRYLTFDEILNSNTAYFNYAYLYTNNNITPNENTPEDITLLTKDMMISRGIIKTKPNKKQKIKTHKIITGDLRISKSFIDSNTNLFKASDKIFKAQ